jgi:hypothetical protein
MTETAETPEVKATRQLHDIATSTGMSHGTVMEVAGIFKRLNDAEAERDAALAVIEQAKVALAYGSGERDHLERIYATTNVLLSSPAPALAEVKADAWDEGADAGFDNAGLPTPQWAQNPYRK